MNWKKAEITSRTYKIAVTGRRYVGLSLSVFLVQHYQVAAVDIIREKVGMISNCKYSIQTITLKRILKMMLRVLIN